MTRARYPQTVKEVTKVSFAVSSLRAQPDLAPQLPMLLLKNVATIRELKQLLEAMFTTTTTAHTYQP